MGVFVRSVSAASLENDLQARRAVLKDITSAVKLLIQCQQFSVSTAVAVGSHIQHHVKDLDRAEHVYLDSAMLLELKPLQELLKFLCMQLGLRMQLLEPYIQAQPLLGFSVSSQTSDNHLCCC